LKQDGHRDESNRSITPVALDELDATIKIIRLRRAGFSMYECSETTGIPLARVRSLLADAVKELGILKTEEAEALRQVENERLDEMHRAVWERAQQGSLVHINTVLKIMERRAKLLALDLKPENVHVGDNIIKMPEWAYPKDQKPADIVIDEGQDGATGASGEQGEVESVSSSEK
jgi:hypothetical protein